MEGLPQKVNAVRYANLKKDDPELFAYLTEEVGKKVRNLLAPGDVFDPNSVELIANHIARRAEEQGKELTQELIDSLLASSDSNDVIVDDTLVRMEHDKKDSKAQLIAGGGGPLGEIKSTAEAIKLAEKERDADV